MAAPMKSDMDEDEKLDFSPEKYPKEITNPLRTFHKSLTEVEEVLAPLKRASLPDLHSKVGTKHGLHTRQLTIINNNIQQN